MRVAVIKGRDMGVSQYNEGGRAMHAKLGKRLGVALVVLGLAVSSASAATPEDLSTPALQGYDAVAYHTQGKAVKGNGYHVHEFNGAAYLFESQENKEMFAANPERYLPEYGGFCAYGVAVGKKFEADAEVWKIVGGKLYLNLDRQIQQTWKKDIPGYIQKADTNWMSIQSTPASVL